MAKYDLSNRMGPFLDRQLFVPLLEFLAHRQIYDTRDILSVKLDILSTTNMVDYQIDVYKELHDSSEAPDELYQRREDVVRRLHSIREKTEPIAKILEQKEVVDLIHNSKERDGKQLLDHLTKNADFHVDMLETLYQYAKFMYEIGDYTAAVEYLYFYKILVPTHSKDYLNALWGKLASEILLTNWENARDDFMKLKAHIDSGPFETELELLQQRAWLIHWSLFVFHNHPKGRDDIIDLLLNPQGQAYLNTVQILCPHILRYLAAAVVVNKKKRACLKDLVKIIQLETDAYRDPVTEFIECLYVNYDFDGAQKKLRECEDVLHNDFFLTACLEEFIESARLLIFEMFCRIHECISISNLAEKLNMHTDDAERWIVNLIRHARLDAKIDSKLGHVIMGTKSLSVAEQVMENTKTLTFRVQSLAHQIERSKIEKRGPQWAVQGL